MHVIGLTGGIGSGKSAAADLFAALGVPVVDTDRIAHELTQAAQPALADIAHVFGASALNPDGSLNRALMRERVFADPEARRALENILHPRIRTRAMELLALHPEAPYQILVVPLLFETQSYADLVARSLVIDCDETLQVQRAAARSGLGEAAVRAIMAAQLLRADRLALANDVIVNNGTLDDLATQVRQKHEKYINTCTVRQSIS